MKKTIFLFLFFSLVFCLNFVSATATISGIPNINLEYNDYTSFSINTYASGHDNLSTTISFTNPDTGSGVTLFGDTGGQHQNSKFTISITPVGLVQIMSYQNAMTSRNVQVCVGNSYQTQACDTFALSISETGGIGPTQTASFNNYNLSSSIYGGTVNLNLGSFFMDYTSASISYSDPIALQSVYISRSLGQNPSTYTGGIISQVIPSGNTISLLFQQNGQTFNQQINVTVYNAYGQTSSTFNISSSITNTSVGGSSGFGLCGNPNVVCSPNITGNINTVVFSNLSWYMFAKQKGYLSRTIITGYFQCKANIRQGSKWALRDFVINGTQGPHFILYAENYTELLDVGPFNVTYNDCSGSSGLVYNQDNVNGTNTNASNFDIAIDGFAYLVPSDASGSWSPFSYTTVNINSPSLIANLPDYNMPYNTSISLFLTDYFSNWDSLIINTSDFGSTKITKGYGQSYSSSNIIGTLDIYEFLYGMVNLDFDSKYYNKIIEINVTAKNLVGTVTDTFYITIADQFPSTTSTSSSNVINSGRNLLMSWFPESSSLTTTQKWSYVIVTIIIFTLLFTVLGFYGGNFKIGLIASGISTIILFLWFLSIAYISLSFVVVACILIIGFVYLRRN